MTPAAAKAPKAKSSRTSTAGPKRTPAQQRMFAEGAADAAAGRPSSPPELGGALATAYEAGYRSATPPKKAKTSSSSNAKSPKAKASSSSNATRSPRPRARRRSGRARRVGRTTANRLARPVERQLVDGLTVLAAAAAIAFLYNLLAHASTTATAIDKLTGAVQWLDSTKPIPYRHS